MSAPLARFLSVILHPLLMPTLLFGILLFVAPNVLGVDTFGPRLLYSLLFLISVGTFGVPALLIYYLFRVGTIRSLTMETQADRRLPYLLTGLAYLFLSYLFGFRMQVISEMAPEISILLGSSALAVLLVAIISLSWKISAHTVGIGGCLGAIAGILLKFSQTDLLPYLVLLVALTGLLASARLQLNAHTPKQIGAGLALGLFISLGTVALFV